MADPTQASRLGRSGVHISKLGLGTAPLGGLYTHVDDDEAARVVRRALELGVCHLDTAPAYGHGTAERRVGAGLAGLPRSSFVLGTAVGRLIVPRFGVPKVLGTGEGHYVDAPPSEAVVDLTVDGVRRCLLDSLDRLGLIRVDLVNLEVPLGQEQVALSQAYPALAELRAQGVIGAIGLVAGAAATILHLLDQVELDVVQLTGGYHLLDRSADVEVLPACRKAGVSVVVGGVFLSGVLARPRPGVLHRGEPVPHVQVVQAGRMEQICAEYGVPLTAAALQFPLRNPAVTGLLVGPRTVAELEESVASMRLPIPEELWAALG